MKCSATRIFRNAASRSVTETTSDMLVDTDLNDAWFTPSTFGHTFELASAEY